MQCFECHLTQIGVCGSEHVCVTHCVEHYNKTIIIINPRCACAAKVTVVDVCMCKSHLTSGAFVRRENAATYSAGNEGQKIVAFSLKLLRCRDRALPPLDG